MCSILGIFNIATGVDLAALRKQALSQSMRQRHRGPDWSGVHADDRAILVHERLAIVGVSSGAQPL
ncbi:MAG: asparagine synthase B, partial [Arenimonas sp.]|nr:asparagine synthase B [Arenimonas sp.]